MDKVYRSSITIQFYNQSLTRIKNVTTILRLLRPPNMKLQKYQHLITNSSFLNGINYRMRQTFFNK